MNLPALKSEKASNFPPVLIVDRIGIIGEALARELTSDYLVVLLSKEISEKSDKIIHIPFKRRIPQVPDNNYKKMFIIDDGEVVTKESIPSFIKKAKENSTPIYFIGSIRNIDIKNAQEPLSDYSSAKLLMFGDLFDKTIFFDKEISVNKYIVQARKNYRILVEGNGLALSFPIAFNDTVKLIIKASFLDIPQKVVLLFYPHPITDISLANTFRKINPDIKIDFTKDSKPKNIYIPGGAQHAIGKYNLEEKIKELDLENKENRSLKFISAKPIKDRPFLSTFILIITLTIFLLFLPLISTSAYVYFGQNELSKSVKAIEEGDYEKAISKANNSSTLFRMSEKTLKPLTFEAQIIRRGGNVVVFTKKVESGKKLSSAAIDLLDASILLKGIQDESSTDPKADFSKALNLIRNSIILATQVKAEGYLPEEVNVKLENLQPFIDLISNSNQVLEEILGFENPVTYLVLLQDNTHIRAGGGLISSYAILKLDEGKVISFETFDPEKVDEELENRIEPPYFIRRYIPEKNLLFKDSNFSPDFVESATSVASVYALSLKNLPAGRQAVDGVIAMDYELVRNLLSPLGEVTVVKKGAITTENLYGHIDADDFSKHLTSVTVTKVKTDKNLSYLNIFEAIGKSLSEKHLLFAFRDAKIQKLFNSNNWSSSLVDNRKKGKNIINDFIGISEANLGLKNINNDISKSISKKISIDEDGELTSKLTISFKNSSSKKGSLGMYKNYMQILIPNGSTLDAVSIDGKAQEIVGAVTNFNTYEAKNFTPPEGIEVNEVEGDDINSLGIYIEVEPQKSKTISVTYRLPKIITPTQKETSYSLKIFKQPGVISFPFSLTFDLAKDFTILGENKVFNKEIVKDEEVGFTLIQK